MAIPGVDFKDGTMTYGTMYELLSGMESFRRSGISHKPSICGVRWSILENDEGLSLVRMSSFERLIGCCCCFDPRILPEAEIIRRLRQLHKQDQIPADCLPKILYLAEKAGVVRQSQSFRLKRQLHVQSPSVPLGKVAPEVVDDGTKVIRSAIERIIATVMDRWDEFSGVELVSYGSIVHRFKGNRCPRETMVDSCLHANWVDLTGFSRRWVITQSPVVAEREGDPSSVNDFWRVCFENDVGLIIDLTSDGEVELGMVSNYLPDPEVPGVMYGDIAVTLLGTVCTKFINVQTIQISRGEEKHKLITRIRWSVDEKEYKDPKLLRDFHKGVCSIIAESVGAEQSLLVHCKAGVLRSGCFVLCRAIMDILDRGEVDSWEMLCDKIADWIVEGRRHRGIKFMDSPVQMTIVLKFAHYLMFGKS